MTRCFRVVDLRVSIFIFLLTSSPLSTCSARLCFRFYAWRDPLPSVNVLFKLDRVIPSSRLGCSNKFCQRCSCESIVQCTSNSVCRLWWCISTRGMGMAYAASSRMARTRRVHGPKHIHCHLVYITCEERIIYILFILSTKEKAEKKRFAMLSRLWETRHPKGDA